MGSCTLCNKCYFYIDTLKVKYINLHEVCIHRLEMYARAIRMIPKGYLPIPILPSSELQRILNEVKKAIQVIINPDYDIVIKDFIYIMT